MFLTDDGIRLHCELEKPAGRSGKLPLVLVFHGFTGHMEEPHILAAAEAMRAEGYATLRAELYGHGQSGGQFRDHTLYKWLNNIMAVVDYARGLDFVSELWLCGHSQGALAVMLAAAMERDRIRGAILLSPAWMIPEGARRGELLGQRFDPEHLPDALESWEGLDLDSNYVRVAQTIRAEDAIERYPGPVLLVHGDADGAVPVQCSIDAAEQYENAELAVIPGDGHCYENHLDQAVDAVRKWMEKQMREEKKA